MNLFRTSASAPIYVHGHFLAVSQSVFHYLQVPSLVRNLVPADNVLKLPSRSIKRHEASYHGHQLTFKFRTFHTQFSSDQNVATHRYFLTLKYVLINFKTNSMLVLLSIALLHLSYGAPTVNEQLYCLGNRGTVIFASPASCIVFHLCDDETLHTVYCPVGQIFDYYSRQCRTPDRAVCVLDLVSRPNPIPTAPTPTSAPTLAPTLAPTVSTRPPQQDGPTFPGEPQCPPWDVTLYPHPTDCRRFYKCFLGHLSTLTCPLLLRWNTETGSCDFPWNVSCN